MTAPADRLNAPMSRTELERRWRAVRELMERQGIDVLYTQTDHENWGYVRYLTDFPQGGYGTSVVFPRDSDNVTLVSHGPAGGTQHLDGSNPAAPGVRTWLTEAYFPALDYCSRLDTGAALKALQPYAKGRIGIVGAHQMVFPMVDTIRRELSGATFVDLTAELDSLKMIKSAEEIAFIRGTAKLQDDTMAAAIGMIEPGIRDIDIIAAAEHYAYTHGSEYGVFMVGSAQPGEPDGFIRPKHQAQRVIERGDIISILVEACGAGGLYCEVGRTVVVGSAPDELHEEYDFALEAQRFTVDQLRPGASCAEIFEKYQEFMVEHGREPEKRIHCHGQGYDLVERPLIRDDETVTIARDMNITCHPNFVRNGVFGYTCDNYLVHDDGPEHIHGLEQKIYEV